MCMTPILVRKTDWVPCGKCPECKARRVSAWSFRLTQHERTQHSAYFITLTYSNDHLYLTQNGFMGLDKRALQLFFKRLRISQQRKTYDVSTSSIPNVDLSREKISYYAVGEYGGRTRRPHYHAIIFNADIELIESAWRSSDGEPLGHVHYGTVSGASIGYCLKYMSKPWRPLHRNDDRQRPFALMSKGLGSSYMTQAMVKWHLADLVNRMYCNLPDGRKCSMPRFYKDHIYNWEERATIARHFEEVYQEKAEAKLDLSLEELWNLDQAVKAAFNKQSRIQNSLTEKI